MCCRYRLLIRKHVFHWRSPNMKNVSCFSTQLTIRQTMCAMDFPLTHLRYLYKYKISLICQTCMPTIRIAAMRDKNMTGKAFLFRVVKL